MIRRAESERLLAQLDVVAKGNSRTVALVGESGSGKTRLLSHLRAEAVRRGFATLSGRCTELDQYVPFSPLTPMLDNPSVVAALDRLAPARADLLRGMLTGSRPAHGAVRHEEQFRLHETVRAVVRDCAADGLVVVVDDFHWADTGSIDLLDYLVRWPVAAPVLIVLSQRPRQVSSRMRGTLAHGIETGTVEEITLGALSLHQSAELLGVPADAPMLRDLHLRSLGNPLFLLALANAMHIDTPDVAARSDGEIPERFAALLMRELATLNASQAKVAAAAAVFGDGADIEALSTVSELSAPEVCAAVDELTQRDLLRTRPGSSVFSFRHPVLSRLVYTNSSPGWRFMAHRRVFEILFRRNAPAAEQAVHIEHSLAGPSEHDLRILTRAAEDSISSAPATAAHWLRVALKALPANTADDPERVALMLRTARALAAAGQLRESRDLLRGVLRSLSGRRDGARAGVVSFCALVECLLGEYAEATGLLTAELAALPDPAALEAVDLTFVLGMVGLLGGPMPSREQAQQALRLAEAHEHRVATAGALALLGLCEALTEDLTKAGKTLTMAAVAIAELTDAELTGNPEYLAVLGWAEGMLGRYPAAERHLTRGLSIARKAGLSHVLPTILSGLSNTFRNLGQLGDARRAANEAAELANRMNAGHLRGLARLLESLSVSWTVRHGDRQAIELATSAMADLPPGSCGWSVNAMLSLAFASLLDGDPHRCSTLILGAGGGADLPGLSMAIRPMCFEMLTAAALDRDDLTSAVVFAEKAHAVAAATRLPFELGYAYLARAHVLWAKRDAVEAAALYQRAAGVFSRAGMAVVQASALTVGAPSTAAAGDHDKVEAMLSLARRLAARSGAMRIQEDVARLTHELIDMRIDQPPADPSPALSVLTDREREIARIAGTGKSSREIAEELSLSPRTVDVHLSRIYRKLAVRGRAELARLIAQDERGTRPPG
ncbi:BREX system ATP-binding domain-containing protein [Actinocrispum sp. NPDC049592]|uniref:ATP-binding protein n=1 Tax=Actinocrispum sp. NPDC049592 TaxID=3154835 RepID=UPI003441CA6F